MLSTASASSAAAARVRARYHYEVVQQLAQRGDSVLRYELPNTFAFAVSAAGMLLVVDLALAGGPFASDWSRDVVGNGVPLRWQILKSLTGGRLDIESIQNQIFDLMSAGGPTGNNFFTFLLAFGGSLYRLKDALFRVQQCQQYGASPGVSMAYGVGVFLSGWAQSSALEWEMYRVERLNRWPDVRSGERGFMGDLGAMGTVNARADDGDSSPTHSLDKVDSSASCRMETEKPHLQDTRTAICA